MFWACKHWKTAKIQMYGQSKLLPIGKQFLGRSSLEKGLRDVSLIHIFIYFLYKTNLSWGATCQGVIRGCFERILGKLLILELRQNHFLQLWGCFERQALLQRICRMLHLIQLLSLFTQTLMMRHMLLSGQWQCKWRWGRITFAQHHSLPTQTNELHEIQGVFSLVPP